MRELLKLQMHKFSDCCWEL